MAETGPKYTEIHKTIIERCKNNDRKAQIELYNIYHRAVYNTCFRILKNKGLSEEVMQETFITSFEKINTFKGESAFGAWLKRIAINKSIDELRRQISTFLSLDEITEISLPEYSETFNFETESINSKKIDIIRQALELLPDGYRVVLSLYLFEGYDHEEIAQILNITESTSRSQYTRARQKLLDLLHKKFGM